MNIVPARIQEQINRVDRTQSLVFGILAAIAALVCAAQLFWRLFSVIAFSSVDWFTLILSLVSYTALGALSVFVATAYLTRYFKHP